MAIDLNLKVSLNNLMTNQIFAVWIAWILMISPSFATILVLPAQGNIVGELQYTRVDTGESLADVGLRYDVGLNEMIRANPMLSSTLTLPAGTKILIPSQYVLPKGRHQGIIINLAEYRLYYFPPKDNVVITVPIGIGRKGWDTPQGATKVIAKVRDPDWHPSDNIRKNAAKNGVMLPQELPGGQYNPLGRLVFRLGWPAYLIHSANNRKAVGRRISAGCIRLLPEDMEQLFDYVPVNTAVYVISQPDVWKTRVSLWKKGFG